MCGVDVKQNGSLDRLNKHLWPMDVQLHASSRDEPTKIVEGTQLQLINSPVVRPLAGQPTILFKKDLGLRFLFPNATNFPVSVPLLQGERVLATTERLLGRFIESISGKIALTEEFIATVTNYRLIVETGNRRKLKTIQWSLNEIASVGLQQNVSELDAVPGARHGWHTRTIQVEELREEDRPPYHALVINLPSKEPTTLFFKRDVKAGSDTTLARLLNLEACIGNAVTRYKGKVPDLPSVESSTSKVDDAAANLAAATQETNDKLVSCPRCANQVSPEAVNCPFCGQPIAGGLFRINRGTREKTPKFVKVSRPLGWLLLILSGAGILADVLLGDGTHYGPWIVGACLAICLLVYVEVGQWWHQG